MNDLCKDLIKDINEANELELSILKTSTKIKFLRDGVRSKIIKIVYDCHSPEELVEVFGLFGLRANSWSWGPAYENTYGGDTDYEKQEWGDVLSHAIEDLYNHIQNGAK